MEHDVSNRFRKARNSVIEYMDCLCDISYVNELNFYVFYLKGFTADPLSRYSKKHNWIELETLLPLSKFETANDSQCIEILKQSILDAIENYKNKNIPQQYIDVTVEKMKASINEFISNKWHYRLKQDDDDVSASAIKWKLADM